MTNKVLIVETQRGIRELLGSRVSRGRVTVHPVAHGDLALAAYESLRPRYAIVSTTLDGRVDAFSLCRAMRSRGGEQLRILMLGTKGQPFEAEAARAAGADAHLGHPFGPREFDAVVDALCGSDCPC